MVVYICLIMASTAGEKLTKTIIKSKENKTTNTKIIYTYVHVNIPEEWMALLLFCITSINAPTIPEVGAGVGGVDSWPSDTLEKKVSKI